MPFVVFLAHDGDGALGRHIRTGRKLQLLQILEE